MRQLALRWVGAALLLGSLAGCSFMARSDEELSGGIRPVDAAADASAEDVSFEGKDAPSVDSTEDRRDVLTIPDQITEPIGDVPGEAKVDGPSDALSEGLVEGGNEADVACASSQKSCSGQCVDKTDPAYGCATAGCSPCAIPHAKSVCFAGSCKLETCDDGYTNCNTDESDGCESQTATDPANCGSCGALCNLPHATAGCAAGKCTVATCNTDYGDCDNDPLSGCEASLKVELLHCGNCSTACGSTGFQCVDGQCQVSNCAPGTLDCDGNAANGCETLSTTAQNCGGCGKTCDLPNAQGGCQNATCVIEQCLPGWGDCDGTDGNGCETNLKVSANNCGSCAKVCSLPNATAACVASVCVVSSCTVGRGDCDGNAANGCEVDTAANPAHCGACSISCPSAPQSVPTCTAGSCGLQCAPSWADCNFSSTDGCEIYTATSTSHCGSCGNTCPGGNNATPSCIASVCGLACNTGFADCDSNPGTGCETNIATDNNNCGACGTHCSGGPSSQCVAGSCSVQCPAGQGDCDGNEANGCETNLTNDANHCGLCITTCQFPHASPLCQNSQCALGSCEAGWGNCDSDPGSGCETNTQTSTSHCGACGTQCTNANGTTNCLGGVCTPTCTSGFGNCDGLPNNGCETNTQTDVANCGTCAAGCSNANGSTSCVGGACAPICNSGFGDCDGILNNGCEANTQTSAANCGSCGAVCNGTNGTPSCSSGACSISCDQGYGACDSNPNNGCETNTQNSTTHCGGCGQACSTVHGAPTCTLGVCSMSCDPGWGDCDTNPGTGCETDTQATAAHCSACNSPCPTPPNATPTCTGGTCGYQCNLNYADCDGLATNGCDKNLSNDSANCGGCGHSCQGGPCTNGLCETTTLLALIDFAWALTLDSTNAYVGSNEGIVRLPKAGGLDWISSTVPSGPVQGIAVDASNSFWVETASSGVVRRDTLAQGTSTTTLASNQATPYAIGLDGTYVYWTNNTGGTVRRIPKTGGSASDVASGQGGPRGIALDATHVYWTNFTSNTVMRYNLSTAALEVMASAQSGPTGIALDINTVYFTNLTGGTIAKIDKGSPGGTPTVIASGQASPRALATDGVNVYWTNETAGTILRVGKDGGTVLTLASGQTQPHAVAVDASHVYWTTYQTNGYVRRVWK